MSTTSDNGQGMPRLRFFEPGGTLSNNSPCYVTREADHVLLNALRSREFCYLLDSRQKGKSSLMVRTAAVLKEEGFQTVVLDLQGRGSNLKLEQWYAGMLTRFGDELGKRNELLKYWQTNQHLGPLDRFFRALEDVVMPEISTNLIVFVDEVDFVRSLPFPTDEFFGGMRHFFNRRAVDPAFEKLSFVLIGTANPVELIADPHLTPFNIGRRIELQDFKLDDCSPLRKGLHEDPEIGSALMKRIIYWTSGHPYLTQRLCEMVWVEGGVVRAGDIDRIVAEIFLSAESQTSEPNLHDVGRRVGESLPVGIESKDYFHRVRAIYTRLLKGRRVRDSQQDPVIANLKLAGLITSHDGELKIRTRIYKRVFGTQWLESLGAEDDADETPTALVPRLWAYKPIRIGVYSVAAVIVSVLGIYSYMWSFTQPKFHLSTTRVDPGTTVGLQGENLSGAEVQMEDSVGHAVAMDLQPNQGAKELGFQMAVHIPRSTPSGRYLMQIRRPALFGFLPFGWSSSTSRIFIYDRRPVILKGHLEIVTCASYSPDGRHIVTAGGDSIAKVWNAATGANEMDLRGHKNAVLSAYYSPDGKRILTASWDRTAILWDAETGKQLMRLVGHTDQLVNAMFSKDGSRIATASWDQTAKIWDSETSKCLMTFKGHQERVFSAAFSPDGKKLATASLDDTARIWDVATGKQLIKIVRPRHRLFFAAFSHDGTRFVTSCEDTTASVWDTATGKELKRIVGHTGRVDSAVFSRDDKHILTASFDGTARVWNAATGKELLRVGVVDRPVNTAFFSPDGSRIVTASFDHTARIWDAKTGKPADRAIR